MTILQMHVASTVSSLLVEMEYKMETKNVMMVIVTIEMSVQWLVPLHVAEMK